MKLKTVLMCESGHMHLSNACLVFGKLRRGEPLPTPRFRLSKWLNAATPSASALNGAADAGKDAR